MPNKRTRVALLTRNGVLAPAYRQAIDDCGDLIDVVLHIDWAPPTTGDRSDGGALVFRGLERGVLAASSLRAQPVSVGSAVNRVTEHARGGLSPDTIKALGDTNVELLICATPHVPAGLGGLPLWRGVWQFTTGNPSKYPGAPAGFHEVWNFDQRLEQAIIRVSERAECVNGSERILLAMAGSPVAHHSWRSTLQSAAQVPTSLLRQALSNASDNPAPTTVPPAREHYGLPSNRHSLLFMRSLMIRKVRRLVGR